MMYPWYILAPYRRSVAFAPREGDRRRIRKNTENVANRTPQPSNMLQRGRAFWRIFARLWKKNAFGACNADGNA